jgi:hydrogenase maturation protein HypF
MAGLSLRIRGLVQGVGFRPHVWRLARDAGLAGDVRNDGDGVTIRAWGEAAALAAFCARLRDEVPPLARIDAFETAALEGAAEGEGFAILASGGGAPVTGIVPDAATCPACQVEIRDPQARRYRYSFTNCTHCGPRLSIVTGIPYDRPRTSMAGFALCPDCRAEYEDPEDRRFHAQPIACPRCGPRLWLEADGIETGEDPIAAAAALLADGMILAVKGIGGFHLACSAADDAAVLELRRRKRRGDKPFALMMPDLETASCHVELDAAGRALLESPAAPIVLLPLKPGGAPLSPEIAPGQAMLGVMLPYTPLHHLLLAAFGGPLVMTSGNAAEEPQCIDNAEARRVLAGLADAFLMHDRDIVNRVDDSVARIIGGRPRLMRRARGYAPGRMPLPEGLRDDGRRVLALGADLKNTFCLAERGAAILSQHLGDLGNAQALGAARQALRIYRELYDFTPDTIVVDRHPDYASTRLGEALAEETGSVLVRVQHHHAHIAACLAENGVPAGSGPVLGIALDGMGHGDDGTVWGGEFLLCSYAEWQRVGRFAPVALPGGDQATREPWRNLYAHVRQLGPVPDLLRAHDRIESLADLTLKPLAVLDRMIDGQVNAPLTSSAGRLFDAAAALLGSVPQRLSFEAEAAQKLEALALSAPAGLPPYPSDIRGDSLLELDWKPLWRGMLFDLDDGVSAAVVARRFHEGVAAGVARLALLLAEHHGTSRVALSGGVFHNRLLLEGVIARLESAGCAVFAPAEIPCGDGGIALGQAAACLALN